MRNNPFCPWLTNKEIKEQFDQIVKLVGEDAAYFIWDEFEGNFDQAFKEAQSISDLMKTHTDPSIWNIEDEIESLRSTFNKMLYDISHNNIATKRAGRDVYISSTGYLSEREARSAANQTPYRKTTKVIEDRGRWYIARITKQEYQDKLEELYNRKSYLIASNRAALGSVQDTSLQTSDPDLNNRLFEGKGVASIGSLLTRLAKDNPNHAAVIRMLSKQLSTATKSWKVILTDFISDPNIPGAHKGDAGVYFQNSNIIYINSASRFRNKGGKGDLTILHEIIHAATYHAAHENEQTRKKLESLLEGAREQISKKYNTSWESLIRRNINIYYGLSNIDEFLAELTTNSAFARELMYLQPTEKGFKHLLDQFVNWLLEVFHVNSTDNLYTQAYYQLYDIIANQQYYNELQNANPIQYASITAEMLDWLLYNDNTDREILASPASQNIEELVSSYKRIDADIDFNEETHTYTNTKTGQVYKSVSNAKTDIGYGEQEGNGPLGMRRRRIRKNRTCIPRSIQSGIVWKAGCISRPYRHPCRAALQQLQGKARGHPGKHRTPYPFYDAEGIDEDQEGTRERGNRSTFRNAQDASEHEVQEPRIADSRRGAAFRRQRQREDQEDEDQRRLPHFVCNSDTPDAIHVAIARKGYVASDHSPEGAPTCRNVHREI